LVNGAALLASPTPTHAFMAARSKPEARLRLYVGGTAEAKLGAVSFLHASLHG